MIRLDLISSEGKTIATKMTTLLVDPTPISFTEVVGLPEQVSPGGKYPFWFGDEPSPE